MSQIARKALKVYEAIGLLILLASILELVMIYIATNQTGSATGQYVVLLNTNSVGENAIEVVLMIVSVPAAFLFLFHHGYDLLKPTIEASRRRRQERLLREQKTTQE